MMLNEDLFDVDIPDVLTYIDISDSEIVTAGPEVGISSLIMESIKNIYSLIDEYNSLSIALTDNQNEDMAQDIADIISTEHMNVGVLQSMLKKLSPNADSIEQGEEVIDVEDIL